MKTRFVANVSHEIRTPLSSVLGMAEILTHNEELSDESKELTHLLFDSCSRLHGILNELLDFAKLESGRMSALKTPFQLHDMLNAITAQFRVKANEKNIGLDLVIADNVAEEVVGDVGKIRQVLVNLISNAIKFTDRGGVEIRAEVILKQLKISVTDTGIGISPGAKDSMFMPFVQAEDTTSERYGGSGLGLSISRQLVTLMGGQIDYFSAPDLGSTFWFTIPIEEAGQIAAR
ncbi:MAG: hypothetical protein K2Z81_09115 [Cyanobacteria bacterium]|nr:hypothetical protein [Cyanobacteriota bacterium]